VAHIHAPILHGPKRRSTTSFLRYPKQSVINYGILIRLRTSKNSRFSWSCTETVDIYMSIVSIESPEHIDYEYGIYTVAHIHASILHGSKCSKKASLRFKNACNYKLWIVIRLRNYKNTRFSIKKIVFKKVLKSFRRVLKSRNSLKS
jgi:hypothetical protein